jgi:hypothetical protein
VEWDGDPLTGAANLVDRRVHVLTGTGQHAHQFGQWNKSQSAACFFDAG